MSPLELVTWTIAVIATVVGLAFSVVIVGAAVVVLRHQLEDNR